MPKEIKALVAVSSASFAFDKPFSYSVPKELSDKLEPGMRVVVPFGRGNRKRGAIVLKTEELTSADSNLKSIISLSDNAPVLNSEMMELAQWLRDTTFCTYYDAVKTIIPTGMNINIKESYSIIRSDLPGDNEQKALYERLAAAEDINSEADKIKSEGKGRLLSLLESEGFIQCRISGKQKLGDISVKLIKLTDEYMKKPSEFTLTAKQKQLADVIAENSGISLKEACYLAGTGNSVAKKLCEKKAAQIHECEAYRSVYSDSPEKRSVYDTVLTESQQKVFNSVYTSMTKGKPECFLLHGVTGSGKTAVFEKLIFSCISSGKQAVFLIPEISLTPQAVRRFQALFGDEVAVLHSGLSLGQRMDEYKRIKRGLAKIAVGTRSAVFAPFENIGIIIVDEEGERSYKSDSSPRYNAIDVAKKRCRRHNAVLLLASATPSVESYYYANKGIYRLLEMKERYSGNELPKVGIVDMSEEREDGNTSEFSSILVDEINENLKNKEQTILLLNRRGYHTIISCCDCGRPVYCPNCSIPMTYHKVNGCLMCHYCGHSQPTVETCPECGSNRLKSMGFGTQKMQEELENLFPSARILRMDADTAMSRQAYEKNFSDFGQGRYDIMIGTQMIGKGLDFPNVTLVGVISMDKSLFAGDFRSYEKTFSLVTQVVGRCGRGGKKGRAYLQTFMPDHYVLNLAARQDYEGFYREEIAIRKALLFPPFCDICVVGFSGENEDRTAAAAAKIIEIIKKIIAGGVSIPLRVLGPVQCAYGKINGKYRYRVIIKCKNNADFREFIKNSLLEINKLSEFKDINVYADINGDIGV